MSTVSYELVGDIAVIRIDDGKANAVSFAMVEELGAALDRAEQEAQAVAFLGRPGKFCAGYDLSVMTGPIAGVRSLVSAGGRFFLRLLTCPLPIVAGCTGHAVAGGAIWLMASDARIGTAGRFKIGLSEVSLGLPLPRYAYELARMRLSKRHLVSATYLARIYDPEGAVDAGYLDQVVDGDELEAAVLAHAARLAKLPRDAFFVTKHSLNGALATELLADIDADMKRFSIGVTP